MHGVHRLAVAAAVTAAALSSASGVLGASPGPMMRGDDGSTHSSASPYSALLVIARGRGWSLDGGPLRARQRVTLARGSTLAVIDGDVVRHRLVEVRGPHVHLDRVGASTTAAFARAGVYRFRAGALTLDVTIRAAR